MARQTRQKKAWRLALALVAGLVAAPLAAPRDAGADPALQGFAAGGDVRVEAENLEVDVGAQTATLLGNVTLAKGDLAVKCPRIDLKFDHAPHLRWAKGSGGVVAAYQPSL